MLPGTLCGPCLVHLLHTWTRCICCCPLRIPSFPAHVSLTYLDYEWPPQRGPNRLLHKVHCPTPIVVAGTSPFKANHVSITASTGLLAVQRNFSNLGCESNLLVLRTTLLLSRPEHRGFELIFVPSDYFPGAFKLCLNAVLTRAVGIQIGRVWNGESWLSGLTSSSTALGGRYRSK